MHFQLVAIQWFLLHIVINKARFLSVLMSQHSLPHKHLFVWRRMTTRVSESLEIKLILLTIPENINIQPKEGYWNFQLEEDLSKANET